MPSENKSRKFRLVNNSETPTDLIEMVARRLTENEDIPSFYLLCKMRKHDGTTITNVDKPIVIISVSHIVQFEKVLAHEIVHLKQHQKGYANEDFTKEVVVST